MRVMIMAAGKGTRLRPVTDLLPKPMAPIANRPALHHILRLLAAPRPPRGGHQPPPPARGHHRLLRRRLGRGHGHPLLVRARAARHGRRGQEQRGLPRRRHLPGHERRRAHRHRPHRTGRRPPPQRLHRHHRRQGGGRSEPLRRGGHRRRRPGGRLPGEAHAGRRPARTCATAASTSSSPRSSRIIPAGQFDDFGSRLFPDLLKQRIPFHCHTFGGYWSDVGNLGEYIRGNADALTGQGGGGDPGRGGAPGCLGGRGRLHGAFGAHRAAGGHRPGMLASARTWSSRARPSSAIARVVGAGAHVARAVVLSDSHVPAGSVIVEGIVGQKPGYRHEP